MSNILNTNQEFYNSIPEVNFKQAWIGYTDYIDNVRPFDSAFDTTPNNKIYRSR